MVAKTHRLRIIFCFLTCAILFFVGRSTLKSVSHKIKQYISYIAYPFIVAQNTITAPVKHYLQERKTSRQLREEVNDLSLKNAQLKAHLTEFEALTRHYKDIDELITFKKRYRDNSQLGTILQKTFNNSQHSFLVNRGSSHGIKPDMVAIYKNCLIGKVTDVYPWYCKIIALTDRNCKIAAYCNTSGTNGTHTGKNNLKETILNHVSHLKHVQNGENLYSSGKGLIFPRGFSLGRVKECTQKGLWKCITIEPPVNLESINHCLILNKEIVT